MESGRVGGETGNCLGRGFSSVVLKYEQIWRHSTFSFCVEVQLALNPKRGWLHSHAPYWPCPPSRRNKEREGDWAALLASFMSLYLLCSDRLLTAISLHQSSAFLFLIPLPPPVSTQQCPAHSGTKETLHVALPSCVTTEGQPGMLLCFLLWSHSKGCNGSPPWLLGRLKDEVGNCKCRWENNHRFS